MSAGHDDTLNLTTLVPEHQLKTALYRVSTETNLTLHSLEKAMSAPLFSIPLVCVWMFSLGAVQVLAANENTEQQFSRYQQAIEVTKQCRQIGFSDGEYNRMGETINQKIGHEVGAKRLSLLLAAQKDARKLIESKGCNSAQANDLLKIYDTELK